MDKIIEIELNVKEKSSTNIGGCNKVEVVEMVKTTVMPYDVGDRLMAREMERPPQQEEVQEQ